MDFREVKDLDFRDQRDQGDFREIKDLVFREQQAQEDSKEVKGSLELPGLLEFKEFRATKAYKEILEFKGIKDSSESKA